MGESGASHTGGKLGGRHARARELHERKVRGEDLDDFESRVLQAHLVACPRCRDWTQTQPNPTAEETVPGGQEGDDAATVDSMEAATPSEQRHQEHIGPAEDAMGRDKRRQVVGEGYGPSKARQFLYYGIFIGFLVLAYFGAKLAVDELDKAPANDPAKAPWSKPDAPQAPPQRFQ